LLMDMMNLTVLTPEREIFQGKVQSVKVPGVSGQFQVLQNHAPIVSALDSGVVAIVTAVGENLFFDEETGTLKTIDEAGKVLKFKISGGFIEVLNNTISILAQGAKDANGNGKR